MEKRDFLKRLAALAGQCQVTLDETMILLYDRTAARIGYDVACKAVEKAFVTRRARDPFPSVADLVALVRPGLKDEDQAVEAANRIIQAISNHGWNNVKDAQAFIGEVGWYVVVRNGGWVAICERVKASDVGMHRAQFREAALAAIRRHKAGALDTAPAFLSEPKDREALPAPVADLLKNTARALNGGTSDEEPK